MKLRFTKMHGIGNDYIYCSTFENRCIENFSETAIKLSDRHFGIGGDGVIFVCPSDKADAQMRMFNADGSEGKMCGNGIRCVCKFLFDHNILNPEKQQTVTIETLSGIKTLYAYKYEKDTQKIRVDMGKADFSPKSVGVGSDKEKIVNEATDISGEIYKITCVSMGNPHCVVFKDSVSDIDIETEGRKFESSPIFTQGVNTEFIRIIDSQTLEMRVWERGSGETLACGTGACASVAAACENGYCKKGEQITVRLLGGELEIIYTDDTVYMTGNATTVFNGEIEI